MQIRSFGRTKEVLPVPSLVNLQSRSYDEFLDADAPAEKREAAKGLEAIFREFFPVTGFDDQLVVSYHGYVFTQPQHNMDECRDLGLTYQRGIKIKIRVSGPQLPEVLEEDVHIGYFPIRIGGGEFIVNPTFEEIEKSEKALDKKIDTFNMQITNVHKAVNINNTKIENLKQCKQIKFVSLLFLPNQPTPIKINDDSYLDLIVSAYLNYNAKSK